jgi:hypothetical protein
MSDLSVNSIGDAIGGATTTINGYTPTVSNMAGRNRIINGDMRIDQRNAGAAVTTAGSFPVDRMRMTNITDGAFSAQQDSSAPSGFINSVKITTTTADATLTTTQTLLLEHRLEGVNTYDLAWGTASAKTVTLSFWVRSSLTGTFGGALQNSAQDRSYPFTYSISVADTWEYKTVTIPGETSGTWLTTNGIGLRISFGLGAGPDRSGTAGAWAGVNYFSATGAVSVIGTLGATFYITGVQLEAGSVATPFEHRMYGQELALCQRYFRKMLATVIYARFASGFCENTTRASTYIPFPTVMRSAPTFTTSGSFAVYSGASVITSVTVNASDFTPISCAINGDGSGFTVGQGALILANNDAAAFMALSAEL